MKSIVTRFMAAMTLAVLAWLALLGATSASKGSLLQPDKLIILSTTDVKGKTSPCG